jgi:hypothetical protein
VDHGFENPGKAEGVLEPVEISTKFRSMNSLARENVPKAACRISWRDRAELGSAAFVLVRIRYWNAVEMPLHAPQHFERGPGGLMYSES